MSIPLPPNFFYIPEFNKRYAVKAKADYTGCEPMVYSLVAAGVRTPQPMTTTRLERGLAVRLANYAGGRSRNRTVDSLIKATMAAITFQKAQKDYILSRAVPINRVDGSAAAGTSVNKSEGKWIIVNSSGVVLEFFNESHANNEAERLAKLKPGSVITIFKAVRKVVAGGVTVTEL